MEHLDIFSILEQYDRTLFSKIESNPCHPLYPLLLQLKESSKKLRAQTSERLKVNIKRFKNCFFNRLVFKYNLAAKSFTSLVAHGAGAYL